MSGQLIESDSKIYIKQMVMIDRRRNVVWELYLAWLLLICQQAVFAADTPPFPVKPLRLIIPAPDAGAISLLARPLELSMGVNLGQPVLVEHRVGAGGVIGSTAVAQAPADGHTLLLTSAALAVNAAWLPEQMPFESVTGFTPVSLIAKAPLVLAVHPGVPAKTVAELVALAKRSRPAISAGGDAAGSLSHVALTLFSRAAGFKSVPVLFSGGASAAQSLALGRIDLLFMAAPVAMPLMTTQRLRALAVTATGPMAQFPGVPVMKRVYPGLVMEDWYALLAPAATPGSAVTRLQFEVRRALADETVRDQYFALGFDAVGSTPEALAQTLRRDVARYAEQIHRGDLRL